MNNCKIVQDLIPNYIEKLTSDETNQFIENHINECEDCTKVLTDMKKSINSKSNNPKQEIDYMKKAKKKMRLGRKILTLICLVVIVLILIFFREIYMIYAIVDINNNLDKLEKRVEAEGGYKIYYRENDNGYTLSYCKDNKYHSVNYNLNNEIRYQDWITYENNKMLTYYKSSQSDFMIKSELEADNYWEFPVEQKFNVRKDFFDKTGLDVYSDSMFTRIINTFKSVDKIKSAHNDLYQDYWIVRDDRKSLYISKENGMVLGNSDLNDRSYTFSIGNISDEDINWPDEEKEYILISDDIGSRNKEETDLTISNSDVSGKILDCNFEFSDYKNTDLTGFKKSDENENLRMRKITTKEEYDDLRNKFTNLRDLTKEDFEHYFVLVIADLNKNEKVTFAEYNTVPEPENPNYERKNVLLNVNQNETQNYTGTLLVVPNSMDLKGEISGLTIMSFDINIK